MKTFIANFGTENWAWKNCLERSSIAVMDDMRVHPYWQRGDREGYIAEAQEKLISRMGRPVARQAASRWFNLNTILMETDGDVWIHREKDELWWTTSLGNAPESEIVDDPQYHSERVKIIVYYKRCQAWSNKTRKGGKLPPWAGIHPKAREFLFTEGTLQQLSGDNSLYAQALLNGDSLSEWHQRPEWRSKEDRAGRGAGTVFNPLELTAARMLLDLTAERMAVGGDDRVREAHRAAVTEALDELERYTQARIGGNHPAETTGKFIAAKFEHDTARPVYGYAAPQLHTHAVIFNVTERADGSTRALQPHSLFESQQYATAVYQSELMYRLRNLGYEIERGKSGAPEIKGYTQEYLDASSPRSQQIREQLEKTGRAGAEAAEIAARSTRDRKQDLTADQVIDAHRKMAAEFGNQPEKVVAAARERARQQQARKERSTQAKEAVTFARQNVFEREAAADERQILRDAMRRGMGETTYKEIRSEFEARRAAGDFRIVDSPKYASGRRFTTPETVGGSIGSAPQPDISL
jgi:hypothetical protein